MLCEKCHANKAVVHITQIVNGRRSELYLCRDCAEKANLIKSPQDIFSRSFNTMFSPFFSWDNDQVMQPFSSLLKGMNSLEIEPDTVSRAREEQYQSFRNRIKPLFTKNRTAATEPTETTLPSDTTTTKAPPADKKLEQMQQELQECIRTENYERAAEIRDEIKKYSNNEE